MFEFDRALAPIDIALEKPIVLGLIVRSAARLIVKHRKVISDDEVKLLISPIASLNWLLRHNDEDRWRG
jgi:hypothetical protein